MARLVSGRLPKVKLRRFRLRLPLRFSVFTFATLHAEDGLDGVADLGLGGARVDRERVHVGVDAARRTSRSRPA